MTILNFPQPTYTPPEEPVMTEEERLLESAHRQMADTTFEVVKLCNIRPEILRRVQFGKGKEITNACDEIHQMMVDLGKLYIRVEGCHQKQQPWLKRWIAKHFSYKRRRA